ncbi:hypothetical protein FQS90_12390 [Enterococcus casseliflavus]|nr:hypothetical protein [Enterococcus casseliflavus]MBO1144443.1 hypothetical protein [Enterococcus casseliflavus]
MDAFHSINDRNNGIGGKKVNIPKFRGKDEKGNWHTGLLTFMFGQYAIVNEADENTIYLIDKDTIGQFTTKNDTKLNKEIFSGDIIEASWGINYSDGYKPVRIYVGTVELGEYEQDASGGEYSGASCIGFYGEFSVGADDDRDFSKLDSYSYEKQQSLLRFDEIEVLGNIHDNPELLERFEK